MIENAELGYTPAKLKALRQKHGLTQQATADLVDVKYQDSNAGRLI